MGWNDVAYPAGWVNVTSARVDRLFLSTDALEFTLSAATAATYEVRDYYGDVVAGGAVAGTSLTLAALPLGWYKLYLFRAASDPTYGNLIGQTLFSVIEHDARLPDPPAYGTSEGTDIRFEGHDQIVRGVALLGPDRNQIMDAGNVPSEIAANQAELAYQQAWYTDFQPDAARPRPTFLQFPNGGYFGGQPAGVTDAVAALYPDVTYFEGPVNEPDLREGHEEWIANTATFRDAVKAGNAAAKVMAPCVLTFNGALPGIRDLDRMFGLGLMDGVDALSVHPYNCVNGDIALGRRSLDELTRVLTYHGLGGIEKWNTEGGVSAATDGVFTPRRQARWWMMQRFLFDQYDIPKERDYYFYDTSHGFWVFPSFWKAGGELTPMIAMTRVYSRELYGKVWAERLDFGAVENLHYVGSRFENPVDGSGLLAFISDGRTDGEVSVLIDGAESVERLDCFGNVTTIACNAYGIATIPVALEPSYVRLPPGVTATVEAVDYGPNVAREGTRNVGSETSYDELLLANPSLVAYLRLGEEAGVTADDATGAHDGTYVGAPTLGTKGALVGDADTAVTFDGVNDEITIPDAAALDVSAFTLEAWVYVTDRADYYQIMQKGAAAGVQTFRWWIAGATGLQALSIEFSALVNSTSAVPLNQWSHVAVTHDGATARFYLNGAADGSPALVRVPPINTDPLVIGSGDVGRFKGGMDEVAIYDEVLTADEIRAHYAAGHDPRPDPRKVTNGAHENSYYLGRGGFELIHRSPIEYRGTKEVPATFTIELVHDGDNAVRARRIDTVVVECPTPWQAQGAFLDFDVEYRDTNGVWHMVETFVEPAKTFASATNRNHMGCTIDSFHSGRCKFVTQFAPVKAEVVRLTVRDATAGGEATLEAVAAGGQGDADSRKIRLREVGIYCRATRGV